MQTYAIGYCYFVIDIVTFMNLLPPTYRDIYLGYFLYQMKNIVYAICMLINSVEKQTENYKHQLYIIFNLKLKILLYNF